MDGDLLVQQLLELLHVSRVFELNATLAEVTLLLTLQRLHLANGTQNLILLLQIIRLHVERFQVLFTEGVPFVHIGQQLLQDELLQIQVVL